MMTKIPGDWKVNDDEGKALPDEETLKRLEENVPLLREHYPELVAFLQRLQCAINVKDDAIMKLSASNRSLVLQSEDWRGQHRRFNREIKDLTEQLKAAKDKIAAMEAPLNLLPDSSELPAAEEPTAAPAVEINAAPPIASDFDGPTEERARHEAAVARKEEPASGVRLSLAPPPCACKPSDQDLAAFVIELAREHGMEPEELCFTVGADGKFTVHNTVPRGGRRRSSTNASFSGAVQSLSMELAAS